MAFNFFRKKETPVVKTTNDDDSAVLTAEELDRVDAGYKKTQDDINKILSESEYIAEKKKNELSEMFEEEQKDMEEKSYSK